MKVKSKRSQFPSEKQFLIMPTWMWKLPEQHEENLHEEKKLSYAFGKTGKIYLKDILTEAVLWESLKWTVKLVVGSHRFVSTSWPWVLQCLQERADRSTEAPQVGSGDKSFFWCSSPVLGAQMARNHTRLWCKARLIAFQKGSNPFMAIFWSILASTFSHFTMSSMCTPLLWRTRLYFVCFERKNGRW